MSTRLHRAVDELKAAMGGRPFVLVFDAAHADSQTSDVRIDRNDQHPHYVAAGLIREGAQWLDREHDRAVAEAESGADDFGEPDASP